jgi:y4mF family transcriptional regulator
VKSWWVVGCEGGAERHIPDRDNAMTVDEIGAVVRRTRLAHGLRQDQLAAAAGVGIRFVVELERGKPTVRLAKALEVLHALGCRVTVTTPPDPPRSESRDERCPSGGTVRSKGRPGGR